MTSDRVRHLKMLVGMRCVVRRDNGKIYQGTLASVSERTLLLKDSLHSWQHPDGFKGVDRRFLLEEVAEVTVPELEASLLDGDGLVPDESKVSEVEL